MNGTVNLDKFMPQTRRAFGLGVLVALTVLAVTVLSGLFFVRDLVRQQIARRDAEALHSTTLMEQLDVAELNGLEVRTDEQIGFDAAVRASRLKGVMGIRFYRVNGDFSDTFPATINPLPLDQDALNSVQKRYPHAQFCPETPMDDIFIYLPQFATGRISRVPILLVTVPLHQRDASKLAGIAQFIVEGESISEEYARLDIRLGQIAAATFAIAGLLLTAMLWPAFRRVQQLNSDLARRSARLQQANDELSLAARVSAVGAVSAHLMHGLKNPLASLSQFVSSHNGDEGEVESDDWKDALTAARRMQSLVEHTLEVLNDAEGQPAYNLTVMELGEDLHKRTEEAAARQQVRVDFKAEGNCTLSSRAANLIGLILVNLVENAIEATPPGGTVVVSVFRRNERLFFQVRDEGGGFPEQLLDRLFLPGKSTREGGSGIGLAISKQIADYLGAKLELEESTEQGCVFQLDLPISVCQTPSA